MPAGAPAGPPPIPPIGAVGITFTPPPAAAPEQQPVAPAPEPAGQPDRAMLHRTELTRTYPCSACGGQLQFDIAGQRLRCPNCGNYSEISAPRGPVVARDLHEAMAELRALQATTAGPQVTGEWEVKCQNCGGTTAFAGSLTATRCPYCATPIQRDDVHNAPARLPVDGVLPFRVDEKHARERVEKWVAGRWFAPSEFKKYKRVGSFAGVYHAYFTYDADTYTWYQGERGIEYEVEYRDSDGELQTRTEVEWYPVSGEVANQFADLPVLANTAIDRGRIKALEPWPIQEATSYSPEYIAGYLARTYDRDAEESFPEARQEMEEVIEQTVRADIGGDRQRIHEQNSTWNALAYKHVLLPIWLLTVIYANQPFQVYINGLTGEVSGERPWSKVKIAFAILLAVLIAVLVIVLYSKFHHGHTGSSGAVTHPTGGRPSTLIHPTTTRR
jgi:DNA-directed RNA polymerase subunit RPC12/RpoP